MASNPFFEHSTNDGIHWIRLLQPTGTALRALLEYAELHVVERPIDGKNRVLLDLRTAGLPPMREGLPHIASFFARQSRRTPLPVRVAYLYPQGGHSRILQGFLSMQRFMPQGMAVKFFSHEEYNQAVEWLRSL
jgi:hypothetical protein